MPVAEKTSNRPAATKSSRTTLLSSFKRLSVQSRRTAHAVLGSVANTPYFFLEHFLSDGDYGRDRTIKARSRLLLIGNYPGLQHEISHVRTSLFKSRIKAENSRPYHLRTPGKTARAAQSDGIPESRSRLIMGDSWIQRCRGAAVLLFGQRFSVLRRLSSAQAPRSLGAVLEGFGHLYGRLPQ